MPPLRVGVILDSFTVPRWAASVIDDIRNAAFAELALVVVAGRSLPSPRSSWYERWDQRQIRAEDDPLHPIDVGQRLAGIPQAREFSPTPIRGVQTFSADLVAQVKAARLDVLLALTESRIGGGISGAATYGIWSYQWTESRVGSTGSPYFAETRSGQHLCTAALVTVSADGEPVLGLCRGVFATTPGWSQAKNRVRAYWGSAPFAIAKLRELQEAGWPQLERRAVPVTISSDAATTDRPSEWDLLQWLAPMAVRKLARSFKPKNMVPVWRLGMRRGTSRQLEDCVVGTEKPFTWIAPPRARFHADPFLLEFENTLWLFFEDASLNSWKGVISVAEIDAQGRIGPIRRVLERPYHLSYPHVFFDRGSLFMIPETSGNSTIELYRCESFPDRWTLEKVLHKGLAVDTTTWIQDGVYWFFTTLVEPRGEAGQLCLFMSDSLTGDWKPHPYNPISLDVRRNRGAGAIFRDTAGRLIRPSQNGGVKYGRSISLNEIVTLNSRTFEERTLTNIEPSDELIGVHSYAQAGTLEIIDSQAWFPQHIVGGRLSENAIDEE